MNTQNHENFIKAIHDKRIVNVIFNSKEKGKIERKCIPFDFGPWRRNLKFNPDRYHFYDLESPDLINHNLDLLPEQIIY